MIETALTYWMGNFTSSLRTSDNTFYPITSTANHLSTKSLGQNTQLRKGAVKPLARVKSLFLMCSETGNILKKFRIKHIHCQIHSDFGNRDPMRTQFLSG